MVIVQCVVNGFAIAPEPHELGILEHPQLMAHRRLAQLHGVCNVLHAQLVVVQCIQDLDAGGVAEHPEQVANSYSTSSSGISKASGCGAGIASFISAMLTSPFVVDSHERLFMCS